LRSEWRVETGIERRGCPRRKLKFGFGKAVGVETGVPTDDVGGDCIILDRSRNGTASNSGV
jgi:hypothetical protein